MTQTLSNHDGTLDLQTMQLLLSMNWHDKMYAIACRAWKQEDVVRKFLLEAPKSKRGLPSRPVTGNAVSIRLNLEQSVIAEWFGSK